MINYFNQYIQQNPQFSGGFENKLWINIINQMQKQHVSQ